MAKVLHLSDIHIGYKTRFRKKKRTNKNFEVIINEIEKSEKIDSKNTAIVITGDIAHDAVEADYKFLAAKLSKLEGYKVFLVPGNHDYRPKGSKYKKNAVKYFNEVFQSGESTVYPIVDNFLDLVLIGLDSFEGKFTGNEKKNKTGKLGQPQLKKLIERLKEAGHQDDKKIVIYFHHHPFRGNELIDSDPTEGDRGMNLRSIIEKHNSKPEMKSKVVCLLYGHNHRGRIDNGGWGVARCYDGSSSTRRNKSKTARQRLIDFNKDPNSDIDLGWCNNT